jgi:hypothetical protein
VPTACKIENSGEVGKFTDKSSTFYDNGSNSESLNTNGLLTIQAGDNSIKEQLVDFHVTFSNGESIVNDYFKAYMELGCLTAGNLILMADGKYKDISSIKEGEFIICRTVDDLKLNKKIKVQGIYIVDNCDDLYNIYFEDNSKITCTKLHKWRTTDNGWKSISPNMDSVKKLLIGDKIQSYNNNKSSTITSIQKITTPQTIYHLYLGEE